MKLYTFQIAKWRKLKADDIPYIDTTFKTGNPIFAPTKKMVFGYKYGDLSEEEYTEMYISMMRESMRTHKEEWLKLLDMEVVAVGCYCPDGKFCHRKLLVYVLERITRNMGIDFEYLGEYS